MPRESTMAQPATFAGLLRELDERLSKPGLSIATVASRDELFVAQQAVSLNSKPIREARHIFDVSALVIERLQYARTERLWNSPDYKHIDRGECEKYLANLEHMMLCIQQAAFAALVSHGLDFLCAHDYPRRQHKTLCDYFSEWSGGRPPLNSTMPWNIKPSLMVLWGVCWMFYSPNDPSASPEDTQPRRRSGSAFPRQTSWPQGYGRHLSVDVPAARLIPPGMQMQSPSVRQNSGPHSHVPSISAGLGLQVTEGPVSHSIYQSETGTVSPYSHQTPHPPVASQYGAQGTAQALQQNKQPPYLRTSITPSTSSDASFATSSPAWNADQGSAHAYPVGANVWQPSPSHTSISTPTTGFSYPQGAAAATHLTQFDGAASATTAHHQYPRELSAQHFTNPYNFTNLSMPMTEHGYPSPHSEASGRESSMMPLSLPETMSPTPKPDGSSYTDEHRDSLSSGSREPPRDEYGQIYCDHRECAKNPPTFARRCEWSKHMDKHTRPYVCLQPGCEKIRGFTYSGGLLRHEREVHRKYGGPKAPRFCPHKDCKRSTGQGFSRKENLHEHLRRVHRGVGISEDDMGGGSASANTSPTSAATSLPAAAATSAPASGASTSKQPVGGGSTAVANTAAAAASTPTGVQESSDMGTMRKRKRPGATEVEGGGAQTEAELREENKRLRHEIAERDQRLRMLEDLLLRSMGQGAVPQAMHQQG